MTDAHGDRQADHVRPAQGRRRWLRYSLRGLFGLVLLVAVGSWRTRVNLDQFAAEHEAIEHLRKTGGRIQTVPAAPQWFWKLFPKQIARRCEHAFHADLHAMHPSATDEDMAMVGRLTGLDTLIVYSKAITDTGCGHCRGLTRLRVLALRGRSLITSRGLEFFCGAEGLRNLDLGGTSFGDEDMEVVARFSELRDLVLAATRVGDSGLRRVTALKRLGSLNLPQTITRNGLRQLDALPNLVVLHVWIYASDKGPAVDSIGRLTRLRQLDINGDGFTDPDLAHVAKLPLLEILDIRGGQLSESGVLALKGAPKLRGVSLTGCGIDGATGARLAQQLAPIRVRVSERPRHWRRHLPAADSTGSAKSPQPNN